jgi:hypothetical protein
MPLAMSPVADPIVPELRRMPKPCMKVIKHHQKDKSILRRRLAESSPSQVIHKQGACEILVFFTFW